MRASTIIVVPCYNEASRLAAPPFVEFLTAHADLALLFIDDGSTDRTPEILDSIASQAAGQVTVQRLVENRGKAEAVRTGILAAMDRDPRRVAYWDADLSTPLDAALVFTTVLESNPTVDVVMGARVKLLGRNIRRRLARHYAGRLFATAASLRLGLPVYDTQCGAKMFRVNETVRGLFRKPFRTRWIFDVELLARYVAAVGASEAERRIIEVPLATWSDVPGSKLTAGHAVRAAWDLFRLSPD